MSFAEISAALSAAVRVQTQRLVAFLPNLGVAVALLIIGWVLGRLARSLVRRIARTALDWLAQRPAAAAGLASGSMRDQVPSVVGAVAFWGVLLMFAAAAVEQLRIDALSGALSALAYYIPTLLTALVIALAGIVAGGIVKHWVNASMAPVGVVQAQMLGRLAQFATVTIALIMAADQAGIHSSILVLTLGIAMFTLLGGIALAFAIGCGPIVGNLVASHYVTRQFSKGQIASVAGQKGAIREITPAFVVLETEREEIRIPARKFLEEVSVVDISPNGDTRLP